MYLICFKTVFLLSSRPFRILPSNFLEIEIFLHQAQVIKRLITNSKIKISQSDDHFIILRLIDCVLQGKLYGSCIILINILDAWTCLELFK